MNVQISNSRLAGYVRAPVSKSHLHRLLIAAALSSGMSEITGVSDCGDIQSTLAVLRASGAQILQTDAGYTVMPGIVERGVFDCGESGSTLRFMLPMLAARGIGGVFKMSDRLAQRPIADLVICLREGGAKISDGFPLTLSGKIKPGKYRVRGGITSQYVTGMLLGLAALEGESELMIDGAETSRGYCAMTLDVLKNYGLEAQLIPGGYRINSRGTLFAPDVSAAEGDWSSAAFFLAAAVLSGDITVGGLRSESRQGDAVVAEILQRMGGGVSDAFLLEVFANNIACGGIRAFYKGALKGTDIDCADTPDLIPVLSVVCAAAEGKSRIRGASRLVYKESDRLRAIINMLASLGAAAKYEDDTLTIMGDGIKTGYAEGCNDHRIVMAASMAACAPDCSVEVTDAQAVNKSYPVFFRDFAALGGKITSWKK